MRAPYREPIRYAEDGPVAASRAITLGPYALQRYRGPVPSERVKVAPVGHDAVVREKVRVEKAREERKAKRRPKSRRKAAPQAMKVAKEMRRRLRVHGTTEPKKKGMPKGYKRPAEWAKPGRKPRPKPKEEFLKMRREQARARYRETHPDCRPVVADVKDADPCQRRKPGPAPLPKPVQIPRDICPHAEERKAGLAADGRQKWKCVNCPRKRTENPRGPGRQRRLEPAQAVESAGCAE